MKYKIESFRTMKKNIFLIYNTIRILLIEKGGNETTTTTTTTK